MEDEMVWVFPCSKHAMEHQDFTDSSEWDLNRAIVRWGADDRFDGGTLLAGDIDTAWASALDGEREGVAAATVLHSFNVYARNMEWEGVDMHERPKEGITPVIIFEGRTIGNTTFSFAMDGCCLAALRTSIVALMSQIAEE
jgi:hypothetical protein